MIIAVLCCGSAEAQTPLGTGFTYQGLLKQNGIPANGNFDFEFNLFDDEDPFIGNLIGSESLQNVALQGGLFTVLLDFGEVFNGDASWLEVRVRPSGNGPLISLFPLQPVTAVPHARFAPQAEQANVAVHAASADVALNADTLDGLDSQDFVLSEVDPTVLPEVKDGVSWEELAGIPAGFADGIDDVGDGGVPVGTVVLFGGATPPSGWLLCDGSEVSRTEFAELFGVLGGTWGIGDGLTTFNLPDLRGRVAIGSGVAPDLTSRTIGDQGGEEEHLLTVDEMPSHSHTLGFTTGDQNGGIGVRFLGGSGGAATSAAGGDQAHNNMPPFTVLHYIVKY
jgi:microcystin-dependent protein